MHSPTRRASAPRISGRAESCSRRVSVIANDYSARDYSATRRNLESQVLKVVEIIRVYPIPPANCDLEIVRRRDGGHTRLCCRPRPPLARRQAIFTCVRVIFNERRRETAQKRGAPAPVPRPFPFPFRELLVLQPRGGWSTAASQPLLFPSRADITGFLCLCLILFSFLRAASSSWRIQK